MFKGQNVINQRGVFGGEMRKMMLEHIVGEKGGGGSGAVSGACGKTFVPLPSDFERIGKKRQFVTLLYFFVRLLYFYVP